MLTCTCGFTAGTAAALDRHVAQAAASGQTTHVVQQEDSKSKKRGRAVVGSVQWRAQQREAARRELVVPFQCACGFTAGTQAAWDKHTAGTSGSQHRRVHVDAAACEEVTQPPQKQKRQWVDSKQRLQPSRPAPPPPSAGAGVRKPSRVSTTPRPRRRVTVDADAPPSTRTDKTTTPAGTRLRRLPFMETP